MRAAQILIAVLSLCGISTANTIHLFGNLNDTADPRIIGPGVNGAGAAFDSLDPGASIDNVVLYFLTVPTAGAVTFTAPGADPSLIDPYLSVFDGSGFLATFDFSVVTLAFGDAINVSQTLAAGNYMVALSSFDNMSDAENFGSGTLGDGFVTLGNYSGGIGYDLTIDTPNVPTPEPSSTMVLTLSGCLLLLVGKWRKPRRSS
jgi:hypothetical protein